MGAVWLKVLKILRFMVIVAPASNALYCACFLNDIYPVCVISLTINNCMYVKIVLVMVI